MSGHLPKKTGEKLPVLVYFYGGGFIAGDGSELRYDGENMAAKGIVVVTLSYRLGVYGFFAHPGICERIAEKRFGKLRTFRSGGGTSLGQSKISRRSAAIRKK